MRIKGKQLLIDDVNLVAIVYFIHFILVNFTMRSKAVFRQTVIRSWSVAGVLFLCLLSPALAQLPPAELESTVQSTTDSPLNSTETDYTLGAGDRVRIDIFQVEDFSGEYLVLVDGTVSLPLAGRIQAEGKTIPEMAQSIAQGYADYLKRPIVTVSLLAPRPLKVAIAGEITRPGSYTVELAETGQFPSVTDMITRAGGLTTAADISQVQIRRFHEGREQLLSVDLRDLLAQGDLAQDVTLRDGDTIVVPTKDKIDVAETRLLAEASFGIQTNQAVNVAVVGEVHRPGSYQVKPEETQETGESRSLPPRLTQAIARAGGIKPLADIRNVTVRRSTRVGSEQTIDVNLWELLREGNTNEDVILQEGDTIVVPTAEDIDPSEVESLASASFSPENIQVNVVGEVEQPGAVQVPPNTPLNQALLAAGGFNDRRANQSKVELIRLNPNGTVSKRKIEVDLASGIDPEINPTLQNNDVVVVDRSGLAKVGDTLGTVLGPAGSAFSIIRLLSIF